MSFNSYTEQDLSRKDIHQLIIGCISPRPIALVSTIDQNGQANLAPFSFFNALSSHPPMLCFSVNVPQGSGQQKDSLLNLESTKECVVNLVNYDIHRQMSLCSINYPKNISEWEKSGFEKLNSELVRPARVLSSPVHFECTVEDIIALGKHEGASNLIICKIAKMHIESSVLQPDKLRIDPQALDIMGRLGRSNYVRVKGGCVMEVYQSTVNDIISYDALPESIQRSTVLTANDIAELASCKSIPDNSSIEALKDALDPDSEYAPEDFHRLAQLKITEKKKEEALICAMIPEYFKNV